MAVRTLPDFKKPPVVEVAISVYFKPLTGMKTVHFGQFWELNKGHYPKFEDSVPLVENVNDLSQIGDLMQIGSLKRIFMITADDRYLMQLQQNAFVHNWRKIKESDEYPHFDAAYQKFQEQFEILKSFVKANSLGTLSATRYEVTYVNHLAEDKNSYPVVFAQCVSLVRLQSSSERQLLPEPRTMSSDISFDLPGDSGALRISMKEAIRAVDRVNVLQIEMTATGKASPDFSDMDKWLNTAHEWIVKGFAEITTSEAHKIWERTV